MALKCNVMRNRKSEHSLMLIHLMHFDGICFYTAANILFECAWTTNEFFMKVKSYDIFTFLFPSRSIFYLPVQYFLASMIKLPHLHEIIEYHKITYWKTSADFKGICKCCVSVHFHTLRKTSKLLTVKLCTIS